MTNRGAFTGDGRGTNIPIEDFAQEDRERTLELLLSQERVVTLLYSKVFPMVGSGGKGISKGGQQSGPSGTLENLMPIEEDEAGSDVVKHNTGGEDESPHVDH